MKMKIRAILQGHLSEINDDIETVWEGVGSEPNLPYQSVFLNISSSLTSAISDKPKSQETGFLQVTLYYQSGRGTLEIEERANQIRQHFYGKSFTKNVLSFGDGYEQRIPKGINNKLRTYSVSFVGREELINEIDQFLDDHGAVKAFLWTPYNSIIQGKFKCEEWSISHKTGFFTLSAEFKEVIA